ncbi:Shedu anti-phage system protein SduA domain-containing protein [Mycolicibacterium canariasense]|uniref:Shedu anti-phage system protein SduA domain-containing protein n=1 Tax=Mycolicibacterium canariasense TaxID=228230 RepID=UPI0032D59AB9
MIYAIEEHTECNVVRFGASDAEGPNGNTFHIAIERFAQYKHDVDLNIRRAQVVVRRIIAAESFNSIADLLGKARVMPTLGRHPTIQAITRALTDDVPLDTEERTALVGRMSAESSKAARENPPAFGKLRQDIDLVTLEVLIEQYRSGLQGKAAEDESWWQEFFRTNTFALQQLFSAPVALFKDQAHVRVTNAGGGGGRVADFVLVNTVARTVVAVEIKTPGTKLLGSRYRGAGGGEVYLPHKELSGAVAQIQAQLESVVTDFPQIVTNSPGLDSIDTADVRGAVIIGKLESLEAEEKRDSFIRYRARLLGIDVLTFDEVYHRLCGLHTMLSNEHGGVSSATSAR